MKCPECNSEDVRRSHSRPSEAIPRYLFSQKHFRCRDCDYRWALNSFNPREDKLTLAIWAVIILFLGFFTLNFLRHFL